MDTRKYTGEKKTPIEMIRILPDKEYKEALFFVDLGNELKLKCDMRYAHSNKYWRAIYKRGKSQNVLFTIECTSDWWRIKACLWNIDKYKEIFDNCSEKIKSLIINSYDCKMCNSHCKGGSEFTVQNKNYKKCIGCCFYFQDLCFAEYQDLANLIRMKNSY